MPRKANRGVERMRRMLREAVEQGNHPFVPPEGRAGVRDLVAIHWGSHDRPVEPRVGQEDRQGGVRRGTAADGLLRGLTSQLGFDTLGS